TVEGKVHLFDPATLGARAEGGFGSWRAAAEQDALAWLHRAIIASRCHSLVPIEPANPSRMSVVPARRIACTRSSLPTPRACRFASSADTATASTTIAAAREPVLHPLCLP